MKRMIATIIPFFFLGLIEYTLPIMSSISQQVGVVPSHSIIFQTCSAFCLENGDHCVFGANQDNTLEMGLVFVNKRYILKSNWDPSTSGEYTRWISKYGSVTVNLVGYQMPWAGMNEVGLMISTMSLAETRGPNPDERPPFEGPFWMQYQLDNHSTVDQVISSDAEIRPAGSVVDHYLVCDRTGACATIEFLKGKLVAHAEKSLPVAALTNNAYEDSINAWEEGLLKGGPPEDESLRRFTAAANRVRAFEPTSPDAAVAYAFDTLKLVSRPDTVWSFVFDPARLRVHFRTNNNPLIRYVDFDTLDFSCRTPVKMLDVHAAVSGDISGKLILYTHATGFAHSTRFFSQYEGSSLPPFLVDTLLWGLESFSCQSDGISTQTDAVRYHPIFPLTLSWAGLTVWHRFGLFWISLVALSLTFLVWRISRGQPVSLGKKFLWLIVTILLGPIGLLAYTLVRQRNRREAKKT
jgi:penicillin V acylase-like amidase (Ntn superfamily)